MRPLKRVDRTGRNSNDREIRLNSVAACHPEWKQPPR